MSSAEDFPERETLTDDRSAPAITVIGSFWSISPSMVEGGFGAITSMTLATAIWMVLVSQLGCRLLNSGSLTRFSRSTTRRSSATDSIRTIWFSSSA